MERQTIALAGVGDLGRYLYEVLYNDERHDVVVLSRQARSMPKTFCDPEVVFQTDYNEDSVLSILDSTKATTLISTIQCPEEEYVALHTNLLHACQRSVTCKRFIPSEWGGNVDEFPDCPKIYARSRLPFRDILRKSSGVEWTIFSLGWFMDYLLPKGKSYIRPAMGEFPIDWDSWHYCVRGTGDELQSWTWSRDVAAAVAELLAASKWEDVMYASGQFGTFNQMALLMEGMYGRAFTRSYRALDKIKAEYEHCSSFMADIEHFTITGAACCPAVKVMAHKDRYFQRVHFRTVEEMLKSSETAFQS